MHPAASRFLSIISKIFPNFFINKNVLDVGGGDINGNNRHLFTDCSYTSNDVVSAPNVTIVCRTKDLPISQTFDTIISSECFEHDPEYKESLLKIMELLKPGGLFTFTCASTGRPEDGTRQTSSTESYGTIANIEDMQDYYKNLTMDGIMEVLSMDLFSDCEFTYNPKSHDLYFYGIKKVIDNSVN